MEIIFVFDKWMKRYQITDELTNAWHVKSESGCVHPVTTETHQHPTK